MSRDFDTYCANAVREHDRGRYLCTQLAPPHTRSALFALYAFDHEIAKARHVVTQPMAGLIRLQWWREALEAIESGRPPAHPIAEALAATGVPRDPLHRAIAAREGEFEEQLFLTEGEFETYLQGIGGAIVEAALSVLGMADDRKDDRSPGDGIDVASCHAGCVVALAEIVRTLPSDLAAGRVLIPSARLQAEGLDRESVLKTEQPESFRLVLKGLLEQAKVNLKRARMASRPIPAPALAALLPARLAIKSLQAAASGDPFGQSPPIPSPFVPLELVSRRVTGRL